MGQTVLTLIEAGAFGAGFTLVLIRMLAALAPSLGLMDVPDQRKQHDGPVPLVGGVALVLAYVLTAAWWVPPSHLFPGYVSCITLIVVVGLLDDRLNLRPITRLVAQLAAAGLLVLLGEMQITSLGNLVGTGELVLPLLGGFLFTIFCVASLVNGLNMLDGLDGLAGSVAAIMFAALLSVAILMNASLVVAHVSVFLACLAGFLLFHNLQSPLRGRLVFLGDAGSMVLGFTLAWTAIALVERPHTTLYPVSAVWILGLVVLDTIATVMRRVARKRSPLSAGRDHMHHLLLALGFSKQATVVIMFTFAAVLAMVGVSGWRMGLPEAWLTFGFVVLGAAYYFATEYAWWRLKVRTGVVVSLSKPAAPATLEDVLLEEEAAVEQRYG